MKNNVYGFMVDFEVPMRPVGKGRPRFTRNGHPYTPVATKNAEKVIATYAREAMEGRTRADDVPLALDVEFIFEPPKSWSKKKREEAVAFQLSRRAKPDCDNLEKLCADAMKGIVYADDNQIVETHACKYYGPKNAIRINVREVQ